MAANNVMSEAGLPSVGRAALPHPKWLVETLAVLLTLGGVGWALDLYSRIGLGIYDQQFLAAMLALAMPMAFLKFPVRGKARPNLPWYDALAALLAFGAGAYLTVFYPSIVDLIYLRSADSVVMGLIVVILLIEAMRRSTGPVLPILVTVFIAYALLANHLPGSGLATDWRKLAIYLAADTNGVLGLPIKVATTIVIAFVLFGQILQETGGTKFFTDIAMALMGRFRGGGAKIAVLGSFLFGSISGSAVANVVATGIVTIPLMKRAGVPAHKAAAIEAVASTGGQLMPPVMGAAAFLMAEFLEISYAEVVARGAGAGRPLLSGAVHSGGPGSRQARHSAGRSEHDSAGVPCAAGRLVLPDRVCGAAGWTVRAQSAAGKGGDVGHRGRDRAGRGARF